MQFLTILVILSPTRTWNQPPTEGTIALIDSDGAAALVLVSGEKVLKLGLQVIAKITGYADAAQVHFHICRKKVVMVPSTLKYCEQ